MLIRIKGILFIAFLFSAFSTWSQQQVKAPKGKWEPEDAAEHFKNFNFIMALPMYKELVKREPMEMDYRYKLAYCYLHTYINKSEAIPHLEKYIKDPKAKPDAWFWLGKAYHLANRFDDATQAYNKYKELVPKDKAELEKTDHLLEQVANAKALTKYPINVTFTNAGPEVNSEFPDYYPWITSDEQTLFFTSRRKGAHTSQVESDGYYSSDCLFSTVMDGKWAKAQNLGNGVNTNLDEQIVGIKPDGSQLVVYIDHIDQLEDLYKTYKKGPNYAKLEPIGENVNKEKEYSGSIFETDDGPVLYFVRRDPKTSYGESDIYTARMLPTGQWGLPQNIGANINTKYREDFPWLSTDGKTLYFSSEGHSSMGGFDMFKSIWDEEKQEWSKPINLGYPLNTSDDERQMSILPDNRAGYISALRPEGMGDLDIYRVKFEDNEQKFNVYRGKILRSDSTVKKEIQATITATNQKTNDEITFVSNKNTGRYVMALLPGIYKLNIQADGYNDVNETLVIFEFGVARPETVKDYVMQKK
jgi:tetratricopeptide (TPR) repeat protein